MSRVLVPHDQICDLYYPFSCFTTPHTEWQSFLFCCVAAHLTLAAVRTKPH